jgi:spore maturation protein SpmA
VNAIFLGIVLISFLVAGYRELAGPPPEGTAPGPMQALANGALSGAGDAITLALGLIGVMALFLGVMKVAEAGGLLRIVARLVRPVLPRLFPEVPPDHPAMGAMVLNISANVLGLGNAATPFGIRAMHELDRLNPFKGTATNAMVVFLAINTSSVTLLPTGVIGLRAVAGSADPAGILPTTLFATVVATVVAIVAARVGERIWPSPAVGAAAPEAIADPAPAAGDPKSLSPDGFSTEPEASAIDEAPAGAYPPWVSCLALALILAVIPLTVVYGRAVAPWLVPMIIVGLLLIGAANRVRVYEVFVEGARDGFQVAVRIMPFLVAILFAVAMFRASGALDALIGPIGRVTDPFGLPAEAIAMALLRTLSGSGAFGLLASILNDPSIGPDSYTGYLVSTIQGSTETTFYVLAVYFGAVGVRRMRHAVFAGLTADLASVAGSVFICRLLYGP